MAVTWEVSNPNGANCYLKSGILQVIYGTSQFDSAKVGAYNVPSDVSVSVVSSSTTTSATGTSTNVASVASVSTTTTYSSYEAPSPCPYANQSIYTDTKGVEYQIECGIDYEYDDLPSVNVDTFAHCMLACSSYVPAPPGDR